MSKFTNQNVDALRHLTSKQFFEVWNNYDQDGEFHFRREGSRGFCF